LLMFSAAVFLVLLNGYFVVAEFSLVKVRKTRLEELAQQGNSRAQLAKKVTAKFDTYLGATQLGITLSSLALGWLGEPAVAGLIRPVLINVFQSEFVIHTISVVIAFSIITFMHIVLGELIPKSLAIQRPEQMALLSVGPLYIFHKIGYPIVVVLNRSAVALMAAFGVGAKEPGNEADLAHSEEELRMIVSASHQGGVLNEMESELIDNVFDFADRLAREVMVPRQDMVCLFIENGAAETMETIRKTGHSRYPVCEEDKDHILGVVHIHDLMMMTIDNKPYDLRSIFHDALVVPEGMSVARVLQEMRRHRTHMVVVADEYGGTAGLITMEDVLEEIVGDIHDEYDVERPHIQRIDNNSYEFDGRVLVEDVAEVLHIDISNPEEDTIGGYIFGQLGRPPEVGDQVQVHDFVFKVSEIVGYRVVRVVVRLAEPVEQ
jgi:CBS domain containing-hemolysin-like protein